MTEEIAVPTILDFVLSSDDDVPWPVEEKRKRKIKIILNGKEHSRPSTPIPPSPSESTSSAPVVSGPPPPPIHRPRHTRSRTRSRHHRHRRSNSMRYQRLPVARVHERIWPPSTFFDMIKRHLHECKDNERAFSELMYEYDRMHNGYRCFEDIGAFTDWFGRERAKEFILLAIATNGTLRATFNQMRVEQNNRENIITKLLF
jgi:hypothetical protein